MSEKQTCIFIEKKLFHSLIALSATEFKVFLALAMLADPKTGEVRLFLKDLAQDIGINYRAVALAAIKLNEMGYIDYIRSSGPFKETHCRILKFIHFLSPEFSTLSSTTSMNSVENNVVHDIVHSSPQENIPLKLAIKKSLNQKLHDNVNDNVIVKSLINKYNNDNDNVIDDTKKTPEEKKLEPREIHIRPSESFSPQTSEELLALDIAESFQDKENLALYLNFCKKYPEPIIRRAWGEVKETPAQKIKKSQGAYFTFLVKTYAQKQQSTSTENSRH